MSFSLPSLPYSYNALEPYIDEETMRVHHDKHHATYIEKLNAALEGKEDLLSKDLSALLQNLSSVPEDIRTAVRNNGGGHSNHTMFWEVMTPSSGSKIEGNIEKAIVNEFGNFETFQEKFTSTAVSLFGSGWAWLVVSDGKLSVTGTPNQDTPVMEGKTPILGLDVWEHAYYLKYQNKRAEYVKAWWNVVNWQKVEEYFNASR